MRRSVIVVAVVAATLLATSTAPAQTPQALADVEVTHLEALEVGGRTTVVATGTAVGCTSACARLFTSDDGGRSWLRAAAAGWSGAAPVVSTDDGAVALVADGGAGAIEVSVDLGESFESVAISGRLVGRGGRPDLVVAAGTNDDLWAVDPRTGVETLFPLKLPAGMTVTRTAPVAVVPEATMVGGVDADGKATVVRCVESRCSEVWQGDATFGGVIADDASETVVVTDGTGTLWVSIDAGQTFRPRSIADLAAGASVTITDVEFAPGAIQVAVVVAGDPERDSFGDSGVYETADQGETWERIGSTPALDRGAYAIARDSAGFLYAAFHIDQPPSRGVACHSDNGWAVICAGRPAVVGTSTTSTTEPAPSAAPTTAPETAATTVVAAAPPADPGPSGTARTASNMFFAIAVAVVLGGFARLAYVRADDRRRRQKA